MMEMRKEDLIKLLTETQQQLKTAMAVLGNDANSKEERAKIPEPNRETYKTGSKPAPAAPTNSKLITSCSIYWTTKRTRKLQKSFSS